jgi:elongation factor Ts
MPEITPKAVKELRDKTLAGMADCKNALVEAGGDMNAAIEILRKKGAASAAKRADRSAKEGLVVAITSDDCKTAVICEINCETDFVSRNAEFERYGKIVAQVLMNTNVDTNEDLMTQKVDGDTVQGIHNEILTKFSENISIRRFARIRTEGYISEYTHPGSKLAVLVEANVNNPTDSIKAKIRDIAMQIAAMNPMFIDRNEISKEKIQKELEIYKELAITEGKKPEMADRIAEGKLNKFYQEQCLVEQTFVKDAGKTVKTILEEISTEYGSEVKIKSFKRFFLGEDLD